MPDSSGGGRQYTEKEIALLLKRATELQNSDSADLSAGLSLEEVEEIARETGIDPTYIRAAAADLVRLPEPRKEFHILGGPTYLESERTIHGRLTDEAWAGIADEVSRSYRVSGKSEAVGSAREWTHRGSRNMREVRVSATPIKGKTRVRITEQYGREAFLMFFLTLYAGLMFSGALFGGALNAGPAGIFGGALAILATLFFGLRIVFTSRVRKREKTHEEILSRVDAILVDRHDSEGSVRTSADEALDDLNDARRRERGSRDPASRLADQEPEDQAPDDPSTASSARRRTR